LELKLPDSLSGISEIRVVRYYISGKTNFKRKGECDSAREENAERLLSGI
jgi:hypothetical protein